MLTSFPNELQSHILSYLPRKDLTAVARASQHLHAVAIRILYLKVELNSPANLESFFVPGSILPPGSVIATKHASLRREHWETIKDLTIKFTDHLPFQIPRTLRDRQRGPLQLERLRLYGDLAALLPLLHWLNPKRVVLSHTLSIYEVGGLRSLTGLGGSWTRLREVGVSLCISGGPLGSFSPPTSFPFAEVTDLTVELFSYHYSSTSEEKGGDEALAVVVPAFPLPSPATSSRRRRGREDEEGGGVSYQEGYRTR